MSQLMKIKNNILEDFAGFIILFVVGLIFGLVFNHTYNILSLACELAFMVVAIFCLIRGTFRFFTSPKPEEDDNYYYAGHHWAVSEINAGTLKRLDQERNEQKISWLKYQIWKNLVLELYIPKDRSQWGQ